MSHVGLLWVAVSVVGTSGAPPVDDRLGGEVVKAIADVDVVVAQVAHVQGLVVVDKAGAEICGAETPQGTEHTAVQVAVVPGGYVRHEWRVVIVQPTAGPVLDRASLQLEGEIIDVVGVLPPNH